MTVWRKTEAMRISTVAVGAMVLAALVAHSHGLVYNSRPLILSRQRASPASSPGSLSLRMSSLDKNELSKKRMRKRDILRNAWGSARFLPKRAVSCLRMNLDDQRSDNDGKDDDDDSLPSKFQLQVGKVTSAVREKIPPKILEILDVLIAKIKEWIPGLRIGVSSFLAGAVIMAGLIIVPLATELDGVSQPVTLFETILGDLDRGYVDEVDTNKLFETGVSAMLRSLDPYTEFEGKQEAQDMSESIEGKYGGIGLVISGATPKDLAFLKENSNEASIGSSSKTASPSKLLPADAIQDSLSGGDDISSSGGVDIEDDDDEVSPTSMATKKDIEAVRQRGITVVSAFEGYAFDYGLRVGDRLVAIDGVPIEGTTSVEDVRNQLRGEPGSSVDISFERVGVEDVQTVSVPRTVVKIRDVKLATLVGDPADGIGYVRLSGFAADAGREMRSAITYLQQRAEDASGGESTLKGLILDLRGNPGGLLTSAVDVTSCLVPRGSDIVSAKGRGFPGILYRSRLEPVIDASKTKLAVLVNKGTASAAEIVSGAVQDLDAGIIVGEDRTFGKGLVQNVEDLPFDTALKFTVAKYYTPSGRCIQGVNYSEGGGLGVSDGKYTAKRVQDRDRSIFFTKAGREVKDGGGVEADYKVRAPTASALEVTLLRSNVFGDFAAEWSKNHELTNNFDIDDDTYREFQTFVQQKQKDGRVKLEALYSGPLKDLSKMLKQSGYKGSAKELNNLKADILREVMKDFDKYRKDIKEDIAQGILARYLPESMLIERSLLTDKQVQATVKLVNNENKFDKLLAKGSDAEQKQAMSVASTFETAAALDAEEGSKVQLRKW